MKAAIDELKALLLRDIDRLMAEISSYENESDLWIIKNQINNSAGNLCLHLCGNLQHFFGHMINGSDYVRQREDEFNLKDVAIEKLFDLIGSSRNAVAKALDEFDISLFDQKFPQEVFGHPMTYAYFMIHLSGHLNYHLGQINYHRRLIIKK